MPKILKLEVATETDPSAEMYRVGVAGVTDIIEVPNAFIVKHDDNSEEVVPVMNKWRVRAYFEYEPPPSVGD